MSYRRSAEFRAAPRSQTSSAADRALGAVALVLSPVWVLTDLSEMIQGGFSTTILWVTAAADAAVPVVVVGLWLAQRPRIGWLGGDSAAAYALSYVFYTFTAFYALGHRTTDHPTLIEDLGLAWLVAGVVFTLAGLGFGVAVWRQGSSRDGLPWR